MQSLALLLLNQSHCALCADLPSRDAKVAVTEDIALDGALATIFKPIRQSESPKLPL